MKVMRPTGSKLHRAWKCPASMVLPWNRNEREEARTEPFRNRGKDVHAFLEIVRSEGLEVALGKAPADLVGLCKALDLDNLPAHLSTEVAFAWNFKARRARELGRNLGHRDYASLPNPPTEDEIAATIDIVGVATGERGSRGYAGDYKTGHTVYPRPEAFAQTLLAGVCVRDAYGCDDMVLELIYIHDDGTHHTVRDLVDGWVLDSFEADVERVMREREELAADALAGRPVPATEGDHCDYCGAYAHCPAKMALIRSIPEQLTQLGVGVAPSLDGEGMELILDTGAIQRRTAGAMYIAVERIEEVLGRIKGAICELGWHEPVVLPDGRVIEPRDDTRRSVDGRIAAVVLERLYGREEAMSAISVETSLDAIRRVVTKNAPTGAKIATKRKDGAFDKVLADLEASGGIASNTRRKCSPRHPRKKG